MRLQFANDEVSLQGRIIKAPWKVADALLIQERIVVLRAHPDVKPPSLGLACYSDTGDPLWEARRWDQWAPYVAVEGEPSLMAWSFDSWLCTIDLETGRVTDRLFTK